MLEYPEVVTLAKQFNQTIIGKKVKRVYPPVKAHKFCWFAGAPEQYHDKLVGASIIGAESFGIYVELIFDNGLRLCLNDGINVRIIEVGAAPKNYQLLMEFCDQMALVFTVAMYGGIYLHDGSYDNTYYLRSKAAISLLSNEFAAYYRTILGECKQTLSAKAFLATEQRFPGIGNGVLQDILYAAKIHPKRKIKDLSKEEQDRLCSSIQLVLEEMTTQGGRDTEKNLFGQLGGYKTKLSKNTLAVGCPHCKGSIVKEAYLGGSVYYCPSCQPLV